MGNVAAGWGAIGEEKAESILLVTRRTLQIQAWNPSLSPEAQTTEFARDSYVSVLQAVLVIWAQCEERVPDLVFGLL